MSRRAFRSALAILAVAGGLTLAPHAEAAGQVVREDADVWSRALRWAAGLWEESLVKVWEAEGWMIDPNGNHAQVPPERTDGQGG
jgi:hypothetical protein